MSVPGDTGETNTHHDSQACRPCTLARKHPNAHSEPWNRACGFRSWKGVRRRRARSLGPSAPRDQRGRQRPADGDRGPRGVSVRTDAREARARVAHPGGLPPLPAVGGGDPASVPPPLRAMFPSSPHPARLNGPLPRARSSRLFSVCASCWRPSCWRR